MVKPKIAIDARFFGETPVSFGRYVLGIARGLKILEAESPLPYQPIFLVNPGATVSLEGFERNEVSAPFLSIREQSAIVKALKDVKADLYHSTTFSSLITSPCPWISNPHDLNHLTFGDVTTKTYYRMLLKTFIRGAAAVVTVSEFSRREIAQWMGMPPDKIDVVHQALDPDLQTPLSDEALEKLLGALGLKRGKYFFCLSSSKSHKNVQTLLEAYRRAKPTQPLVINLRENSNVPGVRALGALSDENTRALYQGARGFFFPSIYEGLGLPPLEAGLLGSPLAVSDIAPHRETLGSYSEVSFTPATLVGDWVTTLQKASAGQILPLSSAHRQDLSARFSAKVLGGELDRVYRRVLKLN
jgi:glycosyltransferase involved in cell wall biosynthesis